MTKQLKADLVILSVTVVWGSSFIIMKNIMDVLGVFAYLSMRFLVATIVLTILFFPILRKTTGKAAIEGGIVGVLLFAGMALQVAGLKFTTASNSAFITGLNVVLVPIFSAFLLRKQPPMKAIIGVILATAGLFLLTGGLNRAWNTGDTLTLLCALAFALQIITIDKFTAATDARLIAIFQIATAAVLYFVVWWLFDPTPFVFNWQTILTILYTGAFGTAFAFGAQTVAQQYTTPTRTALIIACEPVFGAFFALIVPDMQGKTEVLTWAMAGGCLLILGGMILSELKFRSDRPEVIHQESA